jgi:membrane-associated HD superfamily phosphohydrolase
MLADSVEAIAKSLPDPTPAKFREIARDMIRKRIFDGQLDECQLTVADLYKIEESFEATLTNIYHGRVEYPELETGDKPEETGEPVPPPESDDEAKLEAT